ncbi:MAG: 2-keto-4-pentenoate hydratase [Leptospirillia bacterium]
MPGQHRLPFGPMGRALFFSVLLTTGCATDAAHNKPIPDASEAALGERLATYYSLKTPIYEAPEGINLKAAYRVQEVFVNRISIDSGAVVGYKAGLTNPGVQEKFGTSQPVMGRLLSGMILEDGAVLSAHFGARPMLEADLLVRVKSDAINRAQTPEEALASLDAVIPFLELPDLVYAEGTPLSGIAITAINVGARYGVMGNPIPLAPTASWNKRLETFSVTVSDNGGNLLGEGTGAVLMGHPLNVVLWLRDQLAQAGILLKAGDLLSLGSLTPLAPAPPGRSVDAYYRGLDPAGDVRVSVRFN